MSNTDSVARVRRRLRPTSDRSCLQLTAALLDFRNVNAALLVLTSSGIVLAYDVIRTVAFCHVTLCK
jgi:hypothetical protein